MVTPKTRPEKRKHAIVVHVRSNRGGGRFGSAIRRGAGTKSAAARAQIVRMPGLQARPLSGGTSIDSKFCLPSNRCGQPVGESALTLIADIPGDLIFRCNGPLPDSCIAIRLLSGASAPRARRRCWRHRGAPEGRYHPRRSAPPGLQDRCRLALSTRDFVLKRDHKLPIRDRASAPTI
jgi:hypothetical protein